MEYRKKEAKIEKKWWTERNSKWGNENVMWMGKKWFFCSLICVIHGRHIQQRTHTHIHTISYDVGVSDGVNGLMCANGDEINVKIAVLKASISNRFFGTFLSFSFISSAFYLFLPDSQSFSTKLAPFIFIQTHAIQATFFFKKKWSKIYIFFFLVCTIFQSKLKSSADINERIDFSADSC